MSKSLPTWNAVGQWAAEKKFWRIRVNKPQHIDGPSFGFIYRFVIGFAACFVGAIFVFIIGVFTGWQMQPWMVGVYGIFVSMCVFLGEVVRIGLYERVREIPGNHLTVKLSSTDLPSFEMKERVDFGYHERALLRKMRLMNAYKFVHDRLAAAVAIIFLVPLFLIVPIFIVASLRGPIFVSSKRLTYNGDVVKVWQFRSMPIPSESPMRNFGSKKTTTGVTTIGVILRRTAIDELPQLFNVLKGDLSLVGSRLLRADEYSQIKNMHVPPFLKNLKPGITGWTQIYRINDCFERPLSFRDQLNLDIDYVRRWNPFIDFVVLA